MSELHLMPNIGKVVERQLEEVGITTCDQLIEVGSKEAFARIRNIDSSACLNRLYALEGAIQGIRWHYLSQEVKNDLKEYFQRVKIQ